jgi:uncharacterized protein (TIGR02147 family)
MEIETARNPFNELCPIGVLRDAYLHRREKNKGYTLSSFARDLGVSKSLLSRILSGDRPVSMKMVLQISATLNLSETKSKALLLSVIKNSSRNAKISKKVKLMLEKELDKSIEASKPNYTIVEVERFKAMANWYHLAIMYLTNVRGFKNQPLWIAKKLGISSTEVRDAIERLIALGILKEEKGELKLTNESVYVKTHKSEFAVRKFHEQMITKAQDELKKTDQESFNKRLINGITFTCSESQIELIKEKIDRFQDEILALAGSGNKEELYQMNIQFFPLTKQESL